MNSLRFFNGLMCNLDTVCRIYQEVKDSLNSSGIQQWGDWEDQYPGRPFLKNSLQDKTLFLMSDKDQIIGSVVLNEQQADIWSSIPWNSTQDRALIIHALIIRPGYQGKGYGSSLLKFCEDKAIQGNYNCIRLDAFSKNGPAVSLYQRKGYKQLGSVFFPGKPENNREYYCMEKIFSQEPVEE